MIQLYVLSLVYLLLGSGFLLADSLGVKVSLLYSLRYLFRNKKGFRLGMILSGVVLTIGLALFPIEPGPRIIGDLLPMINVFLLSVWFLAESLQKHELFTDPVGRYQKYMGYATLAVALIHFLLPHFVLL